MNADKRWASCLSSSVFICGYSLVSWTDMGMALVRLDTMVEVNAINRRMALAELFLCQPSEVLLP